MERMMRRKAMMAVAMVGMLVGPVVLAQDAGGAQQGGGDRGMRGAFAGMQRVQGEVTAVAGSTLTVKTDDGATMQVVTTDNTRVMMGRGVTAKVADLKVGDGVMAAGVLDAPNKTIHAAFVLATDAAQLKALRENLGKTYIVGRVTAIDMDNAKMTVERPDHVSQAIGFDETTSFRRGGRRAGAGGGAGAAAEAPAAGGGESITLADIKVDEMVRGTGAVKNGTFVPTELVVTERGQGRRRGEGASGGDGNPAPGAGGGPQ
jgi:hypothetical protein